MAKITKMPTKVVVNVILELTEGEARALDALAGYGVDQFIEVFYEKLGRHYLEPYEKDLRNLFEVIRNEVPGIAQKADNARKELEKLKV